MRASWSSIYVRGRDKPLVVAVRSVNSNFLAQVQQVKRIAEVLPAFANNTATRLGKSSDMAAE